MLLRADVVRGVLVDADELAQLRGRHDAAIYDRVEWLRVRLGIVDRHFDLEIPVVDPTDALGELRRTR